MRTNRTVHAQAAEWSLQEVFRHLGIAYHHLRMAWRFLKDFFGFVWRWIRNTSVTR